MAGAVLYVKDLVAMQRFYEHCFAMSAQGSGDDGLCVLASRDWKLSLIRVPANLGAGIVISEPPQRRESSPIKLAFDVPSVDEIKPVIGEAGGQIASDDPGWDFQGWLHLDCLDPEGNVVQLRQRLTAG